jgi:hypothetical protein
MPQITAENFGEGRRFAMKWNIRKAFLLTVSLCAILGSGIIGNFNQTVEARAQVRVADREMKKSRDYQKSDLYERARRIIYGQNPPSGPEGRVRIAIVIDGDEDLIVENRVKDEIYSQLRKKFPREEFAVMKGTDVMTKLLQYEEDKGDDWERWSPTGESNAPDRALDKDGLRIQPQQPNNISYVSRSDFVRAGRECDYDYIFAVTVSHGNYYEESHNFVVYNSKTYKKSVWLRVRFVDLASGDYLYRRDIVAYGETGGVGTGRARKYQWGVREAMKEVLDDISVTY